MESSFFSQHRFSDRSRLHAEAHNAGTKPVRARFEKPAISFLPCFREHCRHQLQQRPIRPCPAPATPPKQKKSAKQPDFRTVWHIIV
jgi:hypothetical protein